ncbi:MAG: hypothetical protein HZB53_09840 [Chloroflexi bacterium]|nr:hypothetical protein [Chloroflexota bacterium]
MTSTFIGAIIGWLGELFSLHLSESGIFAVIAVAVILMARELRWISLPLPQVKRQTKDFWSKVFPSTIAAALWGFDLGLVFTTYFTFSGAWLLAVVAAVIGQPGFGAVLFGIYWLGRALSVWVAPLVMPNASATSQLLDRVHEQRLLFQRAHVFGLAWSMIVLLVLLTLGVRMQG